MATGKDLFQERLNRLEKTAPSMSPAPTPAEKPSRATAPKAQVASEGSSVVLGAVALLVLILGGGAFATMAFAPELIFSTEALPIVAE